MRVGGRASVQGGQRPRGPCWVPVHVIQNPYCVPAYRTREAQTEACGSRAQGLQECEGPAPSRR